MATVRTALMMLLAVILAGCAKASHAPAEATLILLTRDGCAMSAGLRDNLDLALRQLKISMSYQVIDEAGLAPTDARSAYPTPTILYAGRDLFGLSEPTPPFPEPT